MLKMYGSYNLLKTGSYKKKCWAVLITEYRQSCPTYLYIYLYFISTGGDKIYKIRYLGSTIVDIARVHYLTWKKLSLGTHKQKCI